MQTLFLICIFAGSMLYITKLISFYALLSPFPGFKKWIVTKPVRLAIVDLLFGLAGMHVVSLAGGSVSAMMIMIVYGTCSILYLTIMIGWQKGKSKWKISKLDREVSHVHA